MQAHATTHAWLELENNATFYSQGSHDGRMQNFVTPAAFYVVRDKNWKPEHSYLIFAGGMQIATSSFHTCNHNLISELRILSRESALQYFTLLSDAIHAAKLSHASSPSSWVVGSFRSEGSLRNSS